MEWLEQVRNRVQVQIGSFFIWSVSVGGVRLGRLHWVRFAFFGVQLIVDCF